MKADSLMTKSRPCVKCHRPVGIGYLIDGKLYCVTCYMVAQDVMFFEMLETAKEQY